VKRVGLDYLKYMEGMKRKDFVITDSPWNLADRPPSAQRQLAYTLWRNDVEGMFSIFKHVKTDLLFVYLL